MNLQLKQKLQEIIDPICVAHDVELADFSYAREASGAVLRVLIHREPAEPRFDKKGKKIPSSDIGITDCQNVSKDLSLALDVHEPIPDAKYRLEVSSPGIERPLVHLRDFLRFIDSEVFVQTQMDRDGRRRFQGILREATEAHLLLEDGSQRFEIPLVDVQRANVVYRF